ncbi:hypothetical protein CDAR_164401, partial [Caerostris darwini]
TVAISKVSQIVELHLLNSSLDANKYVQFRNIPRETLACKRRKQEKSGMEIHFMSFETGDQTIAWHANMPTPHERSQHL